MKTLTRLGLVGLGLTTAGLASAQISNYDFFRSQFYTQTNSDATPTTGSYNQINLRVFSTNFTDVTNVQMTAPGGTNYQGNNYYYDGSQYVASYLDGGFATQGDEEAKYSSGSYVVETSGNYAGSATFTVPTTSFADAVPYFTGTTFNDLQSAVAGTSVNLTWNQFTNSDPNADTVTFLGLQDTTTNTFVYGNNGEASAYTGDTINGSLLKAGDSYQLSLYFSSRYYNIDTASDGAMVGVPGLVGFDQATTINFTVAAVPEPVSMTLLGLGAVALMRRRKN